ncbi:sigma-70 family RNA polymerase sigma factor [Aestuariivirga sp.]|uniref:sigma-70 family RNA polymerase sigma factor n=1 Tax=Aestuariivirga sp. TaxID=2650926 RepID=UPI00391BE82D
MTRCTFCNDYAGTTITVPYDYLPRIQVNKVPDDVAALPVGLPGCVECKELLDEISYRSLEVAAGYIASVFRERYDHLLSDIKWTRDELDELGHGLRASIEQSLSAQLEIKARVDHCDRVSVTGPELSEELRDEIEYEISRRAASLRTPEPAPSALVADPPTLGDLPDFVAEEDAEEYFKGTAGTQVRGTFVQPAVDTGSARSGEDVDWELDLSPSMIAGEGIGLAAGVVPVKADESDFLKVRSGGRQSTRTAVLPTSTQFSVDPTFCMEWAFAVTEKRYFTAHDLDALIDHCDGNFDPEELRFNLLKTLEAAEIDLREDEDFRNSYDFETASEVSVEELAEALEATCSRATLLPGTSRFTVDRAREAQLLETLVRAKQDVQLGVLSYAPALEIILDMANRVIEGSVDARYVTMRNVLPSQPNDKETRSFLGARDALKSWAESGRVMEGRRRREALAAVDALDMSLMSFKTIVDTLAKRNSHHHQSARLDALVSAFESAIERLVMEHLPFARRFAARNVGTGEDPEDVFQIAFMGLQRATRRFDPERGHRFVIYSSFWMKQNLARWRADEGLMVRIPVHRHERIAKFDLALDALENELGRRPSTLELVERLGWEPADVERVEGIPRSCVEIGDSPEIPELIQQSVQQEDIEKEDTRIQINRMLDEIPERESAIVRMRFGIGCEQEMTLEEVGQMFGVTRERIRQIEAKAVRRLSHPARIRRLQALAEN